MLNKIKSLFGAQDMTQGSVFVCLLKFTIPLLIGNLAQMLYTTVDRIVVGQYLGDVALAAVGASMPIQNIFLVFLMAIGGGVTILVSQYFGAKDMRTLGHSVGNAITLMVIMSVVLTAVSVPMTGTILKLTKTAPDMIEMSHTYLVILFWGTAANGFYNVMSGILRGLGDSVFPLIVLLITVLLNVVLDIWFVAGWGLDMGIAGAAYATIISQIISAVLCIVRVLRMKNLFKISKDTLKLRKNIVMQITRMGLPTGIQMAIMFLSNIVMQPFLMAMGSYVFSAMTAMMSIDGFAILPCQAFSMAASTFTGQNIGAGKLDRVKNATKTSFLMCLAFTAVMVVLMLVFGSWMFGLFTETTELIELGMSFIRIMVPAYFLMTVNMTLTGVMRGAGDALGTMWISVLINVILKVPTTILLIKMSVSEIWPAGNPAANFYAMLICMSIGCVITIIYYRLGKWKTKGLIKIDSREAAAV